MIVAIHQPNFFPWLGYFHKIASSDSFVFLDDAQLPKTGASWITRVQLMIAGEAKWFTVPVDRSFPGTAPINSVSFDGRVPWRKKLLKTLEANYRKSLHYKEIFPFLNEIIEFPNQNIAIFNIHCIETILKNLEVKSKLIRSSEMNVDLMSTQRLVAITKQLGGHTYLCGTGAGGYQEDDLFPLAQLELKYQNFTHPSYAQNGVNSFTPGLSIIDSLMHNGIAGTRKLLINEG